jgi:inhibitor of cysteine peptidase
MMKSPFYLTCIIGIYIGCIFATQVAAIPSKAIAACPCQAKQQVNMAQKEYADPRNPINTKAGETISIILDSNPTTGYKWQLAKPADEKVLQLVSSEYRMPETQMVGAGGKEVWTFKALSTGQTNIVFEYLRPWEKDKEPAKKATFTINIQ